MLERLEKARSAKLTSNSQAEQNLKLQSDKIENVKSEVQEEPQQTAVLKRSILGSKEVQEIRFKSGPIHKRDLFPSREMKDEELLYCEHTLEDLYSTSEGMILNLSGEMHRG